ncbi:MAG: Glyoxalase-like domain protein [Gemmatimonadetes bacterium]|nr:Glyoxalase-like domain protein [Gemmatimonadota bacterium]
MSADRFGLAKIGQVAIGVADLDRAIGFYRDILGMRFLFQAPPGLAFFDCGGIRLMLDRPARDNGVGTSIIYYQVDDIEESASALKGRGAVFESEPHLVARMDDAELWMGFVRDTEGNLLAVMSEVAIGQQ